MGWGRNDEPPPNPTKESDSRFTGYEEKYGNESWELDALEPTVLGALVSTNVRKLLDVDAWNEKLEEEREGRRLLEAISANWDDVSAHVRSEYDVDGIDFVEPDDFESVDDNDDEEGNE